MQVIMNSLDVLVMPAKPADADTTALVKHDETCKAIETRRAAFATAVTANSEINGYGFAKSIKEAAFESGIIKRGDKDDLKVINNAISAAIVANADNSEVQACNLVRKIVSNGGMLAGVSGKRNQRIEFKMRTGKDAKAAQKQSVTKLCNEISAKNAAIEAQAKEIAAMREKLANMQAKDAKFTEIPQPAQAATADNG